MEHEGERRMALIEYLYFDQPRIDAYVQQIGPPITYDKVPVWKAELGLTGPKASASQDRHPRALTTHEKISVLQKHLEDNKLIFGSRPAIGGFDKQRQFWGQIDDLVFVEERCIATKVHLSPTPSQESSAPGVTLWISTRAAASDGEHLEALLCLLQDYRETDGRPNNHYLESAYTLLESIIWALNDQFPKLLIADAFHKDHPGTMRSSVDAWHKAAPHMHEFASDPVAFLERNGCRPSRPRAIRTLYRIRDFGPEFGYEHQGHQPPPSIFGYPIYIAAE